MVEKALASDADTVFLDLEDAVALGDKAGARTNVAHALKELDWRGRPRLYRANALDTPYFYRDLIEVVEDAGDALGAIVIPKVDRPEDFQAVSMLLSQLELAMDLKPNKTRLEAQIESAEGLTNADAIARSTDRLEALHFGSGDLAASLLMPQASIGVVDEWDEAYPGHRYHYAMQRIVVAARAAGLRVLDGPVADHQDEEGLRQSCLMARSLGFDGKWCIHPVQIGVVNEVFSPTRKEVEWAKRIVAAYEKANVAGSGSVSVDGQMVDAASIKMARGVFVRARATGNSEGRRLTNAVVAARTAALSACDFSDIHEGRSMVRSKSIKTEVPGPKSKALMERRREAVPSGVGTSAPIFASRARGALLTDVDGNTFIDFAGGIGVLNVGHTDPSVVEGIKDQAERMTHTSFATVPHEPYVELAERLNALVPGDFKKRTVLVNTGAEAMENAIKIARRHTGRGGILVFENGLHGRTLLTMSMTSKVDPYKKSFGPFAPEIYRVPAPYPYRCPAWQDCSGGCLGNCFDFIERAFTGVVDPRSLAALAVEPVIGEGRFIPFPDFYLKRLRELCDDHGILMIADEVQTGLGRTGKMFAIEHCGVVPDMVTMAKSMGGGMPIGGVTGKAEIMDSVHAGGLGTTYGGNPVACAAVLGLLEAFEEKDLISRGARLGELLFSALRELQKRHPDTVGDVRGKGAMVAIEVVTDRRSREPDAKRAAAIVRDALEGGLLLITAGRYSNVIRTLVPLVISDEELQEGLDILDGAVASVS